MIERADDTSKASPHADEAAPSGMIRQLGTILGAARRSPVGRALWTLAVAILVVILVTAYGQICSIAGTSPSTMPCRGAICATSCASSASSS